MNTGKKLFATNAIKSVSLPQKIEPEPLVSKIANALSKLANRKFHGLDIISVELIKHGGRTAVEILHFLS